jgi:hypothetical protein
METNIKIFS